MKNLSRILTLVIAGFAIIGCAFIQELQGTPVVSVSPPAPQEAAPTATLQLPTPTAQVESGPITLLPLVQLLGKSQIIFTIPNTEPWTGREGEARPDWKGWGAQTFAVSPDGTFWVADTAVTPDRLLQFSSQGELLKEISLQDLVVYPYDILVTQEAIWVLDISADQPKVVKLDMDGKLLSGMDIPQAMMSQDEMFSSNGAYSLLLSEAGNPLLATLSGYYELVEEADEIVAHPVEALTFSGHTYQEGIYDPATGQVPIYVDGARLELPADFIVEPPFLGINPDGSFALAGFVLVNESQVDNQVKYFDSAGNNQGTARQQPQTIYKDYNHHLAMDQNGAVYQLLSNPDHSVQMLRLGFVESLPPAVPITVAATPTPMTPLALVEPAATEAEQARNALIGFFADLSAEKYAEAAAVFGGVTDEFLRDPLPDESVQEYWNYLCDYYWCLPVVDITDTEQVSEDEYLFYTVFRWPDGTRFEIGACCGEDPAATPPVWQFVYPVKRVDGVWKVMRPPLFTP